MEDSLFTKIIKGDIPAHKVYEDEQTIAFLDIHPISAGHVLVVPKKQVAFLWDLDAATYQAVMAASQKLAIHMRQVLDVPYVGVQVIGVDIPHAHLHLIPFHTTAEFRHHPDMAATPDHQQLAAMAEKLRI